MMRGLYFIEHNLAKAQAEALCQAIGDALLPLGLQSYESQADAGQPISLMEACQRAYLSTLGVFDLSVASPNLYLEIGISIGLNRPTLIIAGRGMVSAIPPALERANIWLYTPPLKPERDLQWAASRALDKASPPQASTTPASQSGKDYCVFCGQPCPGWRKPTHNRGFLLLDATRARWNTLREAVRTGLELTDLTPIYLTQFKARTMPLLCEVRLGVMASSFTMLDVSDTWSPEQAIALGMAIGACRPWLLVTSQPASLPPLLRQANTLKYSDEQNLQQQLGPFLVSSLYSNRAATKQGVTTRLELPFWLRLQDWISHFKFGVSRAMEGALQLLLVEEGQLKQRCRLTQSATITAGRDPECDLVIESQSATRVHAEFVFSGQELFVVDRESTNGTFVDGNRIPAGEQVSLKIGNRVRIGPAEVIVWDDKELPDEIKQYLPRSEQAVPQAATIVISLADGLVLADGQVPVARLSASEASVVETMHKKGSNTTSTGEIAQLVYGSDKVSRMIVASFIDGLRAKIESTPSNPRFLTSVPGQGYRLHTRGGQLVIRPRE
jgi:pSer/pThr/pTyr-binding forkhead associated (FHA) protein